MANDFETTYRQIIAKAWKDPQFKAKLLKNPKAAFQELGVKIDPNVQMKVVEDTPTSRTFVLPPPASGSEELSEKELSQIAAGAGKRCTKSFWTTCP